MNEPTESARVTTLDRKIEAAGRRAEAERKAVAQVPPTHGLTSAINPTVQDSAMARKDAPAVCAGDRLDHSLDGAFSKVMEAAKFIGQQHGGPGATPLAMALLREALQDDPDYARSWHDNLTMAFIDGMRWEYEARDSVMGNATHGMVRIAANRSAAHFMQQCFGVDTSEHAKRVTEPAKIEEPIKAWYDEVAADMASNREATVRPSPVVFKRYKAPLAWREEAHDTCIVHAQGPQPFPFDNLARAARICEAAESLLATPEKLYSLGSRVSSK